MKIWIISESSPPPSFPGITRHYNLAKALEKIGNEVTIVTTNFSHLKKIPLVDTKKNIIDQSLDGIRYKLIRSVSYQRNGIFRLLSMFLFSFRIAFLNTKEAPDIIIGSSPSPFSAYAGMKLARKLGIPFILEIRDLWPETLISLGNISQKNPIIILMKYIERALYKHSDHILSVLPGAYEYFQKFGVSEKNVSYLPNFVHISEVPIGKNKSDSDKFNVYYSGSLGLANSIETLLDAAEILQSRNMQNITINILGDGPNRLNLIAQAKKLNLKNVIFQETVKKSQIYSTLQSADAFVILFKDSNLYRWGFSPNKLFDYMALGKPIICAVNTKYDLVAEANCGITVRPENPLELAQAIIQIFNSFEESRQDLGKNGRRYAEKFHNVDNITETLDGILRAKSQNK